MRWDNLFDDLEGQLEHELSSDDLDLRAEEERLRLGRMSLRDRIVAIQAAEGKHTSYAIRVELVDGSRLDVRPATIGRDWFSADLIDGTSRETQGIVPLTAIAALVLARSQVQQSLNAVNAPQSERGFSARLTLSFVLRDLCRRRTSLELRLVGSTVFGTIDRVGRDHLDLAVHEAGSSRRESAVREYRVVPFGQVLFVRV